MHLHSKICLHTHPYVVVHLKSEKDKYLGTEGVENSVGDDGVRAIQQYRPSDLYIMDRKETMAILQKYTHTPLQLQIRPSLVHPFLSQDKLLIQMHLDVPCNAWASS